MSVYNQLSDRVLPMIDMINEIQVLHVDQSSINIGRSLDFSSSSFHLHNRTKKLIREVKSASHTLDFV
jgi:hypothetical protein